MAESFIQQVVLEDERERDPGLKPINKEYSDRLLEKLKTGSRSLDYHMQRLLNRYLVFPIGETEDGCAYCYFHKPNENTELSFIGGELVIYDKTFCEVAGEKVRVTDKRYRDFMETYKQPKVKDPDHLYRGMRGEEFNKIAERGFINSDKSQSFSFQKDITCFTPYLWMAFGYAYNISSIRRDGPVFGYPSYVVKVKRKGVKYKLMPGSEAWVKGNLPVTTIVQVYEIRLGLANSGRFDLIEVNGEVKRKGPHRSMTTLVGFRTLSDNEIKDIQNVKSS